MSETLLVVGVHPDDIELGAGGTIAYLTEKGYHVVGLSITKGANEEQSRKRIEAMRKSSEILGYEAIMGHLFERELLEKQTLRGLTQKFELEECGNIKKVAGENLGAEDMIYRVTRCYEPLLAALHNPEDELIDHIVGGNVSISATRFVPNILLFAGPSGQYFHSTTPVGNFVLLFDEKHFEKKMEALKVHEDAFGHARYFTREYQAGISSAIAQSVLEFEQRDNAPYINGKKLPYGEAFIFRRGRMEILAQFLSRLYEVDIKR